MPAAELRKAKREFQKMRLLRDPIETRRWRPSHTGHRIDARRTMRAALKTSGTPLNLQLRARHKRPPPLVAICDISGSMEQYSRVILHFLHALSNDRDRVHSFVFGTRLTNITRSLKFRDIDYALSRVGQEVKDWSGGTRIGAALKTFNHLWSRRVLGQSAIVLLITDGIDRDLGEGLEFEIDRLHRSCRRLIWLNPLLRYREFQPKAAGVKAILPHVDEMRPVHSLESLEALTKALSSPSSHHGVQKYRQRSL